MVLFIAKVVYSGEGAAVSFDKKLSYPELCDKIRVRFPQLQNVSFRLKYTVHPDPTVFQLEDEVDIKLLFLTLGRCESDFVDIDVYANVSGSNVNVEDESGSLEANEHLGCITPREDAELNDCVSNGLLEANEHLGCITPREDAELNDCVSIGLHEANEDVGCITPRDDAEINDCGSIGLLEANEHLGCVTPREDGELNDCGSSGWKYYIVSKGQVFEGGVKEFRVKLRMYAIEVGFEYTLVTNKAHRVMAICKKASEGCNWCVKATLRRHNGFFVIYSLFNEHTCLSIVRDQKRKSKMMSSVIVKEVILDKLRDNPNSKAIEIQQDIKVNFGLDIPYHTVWYGTKLAKKAVLGVDA